VATVTKKKKHGVVVAAGAKHKTKTIWNRGHRMVTYRRQPLRIRFKSKMVNDTNQNLCGGWFMDGATGDDINRQIEKQLISCKKPLGVMVFWDEENTAAKACVSRLKKAGLAVRTSRGWRSDQTIVEACHDIRVGDIGDLGDLVADYIESGAIGDASVDNLCREFNVYSARKLKSFLGGKWDMPNCPAWVTGLVLGYPVENTISLYANAIS
jgi:hypothetical protein